MRHTHANFRCVLINVLSLSGLTWVSVSCSPTPPPADGGTGARTVTPGRWAWVDGTPILTIVGAAVPFFEDVGGTWDLDGFEHPTPGVEGWTFVGDGSIQRDGADVSWQVRRTLFMLDRSTGILVTLTWSDSFVGTMDSESQMSGLYTSTSTIDPPIALLPDHLRVEMSGYLSGRWDWWGTLALVG